MTTAVASLPAACESEPQAVERMVTGDRVVTVEVKRVVTVEVEKTVTLEIDQPPLATPTPALSLPCGGVELAFRDSMDSTRPVRKRCLANSANSRI